MLDELVVSSGGHYYDIKIFTDSFYYGQETVGLCLFKVLFH